MSAFDRLLFIGLWCLADREGRIEDRPKRIKLELFPCDTYDVDAGIEELKHAGFVTRYDIAGKKTISIVNFLVHQTPHGTEKDSELPDENGNFTVLERDKRGYATGKKRTNNVKSVENNASDQFNVKTGPISSALTVNPPLDNALNPDSLNPDSLNPESKDKAQAPPVDVPLPDWIPMEAWDGYAEMRKKIRKPMTARAKKLVVKSLDAMRAKGHDVGQILDESTKNAWIDVYEPKKPPTNVVQLGPKRGSDEYCLLHKKADWVTAAGFEDVWNATSAGCYHDTAHRFANGKKLPQVMAK